MAIFDHTEQVLENVKAAEVRIRSLFAADRHRELLEFGAEFLAELGLRLTLRPNKLNVIVALLRAKRSLAGKSDEDLLDLPPMSDERVLAAMRI